MQKNNKKHEKYIKMYIYLIYINMYIYISYTYIIKNIRKQLKTIKNKKKSIKIHSNIYIYINQNI